MIDVHAVILAGGSGSRLLPVIKAENILVVTQEAHAKGEAYPP
jgi:dTDP-glucose pyrophosphorylase